MKSVVAQAPKESPSTVTLSVWNKILDCGFAGADPYQLDDQLNKLRRIPVFGRALPLGRRLLKPFHHLIPRRVLLSGKPLLMPQVLAYSLSGACRLQRLGLADTREVVSQLTSALHRTRSSDVTHFGWGLPFAWGGDVFYPAGTPMAITTAFVLHALLDHAETWPGEGCSEMIEGAVNYLLTENGHWIDGSSLCWHYSTINPELTYNPTMVAATALERAGRLMNRPDWFEYAQKAVEFVVSGQNKDGSWNYSDGRSGRSPDLIIDSRHTLFILEHLWSWVQKYPSARLSDSFRKGERYYEQSLTIRGLPKWAPEQAYPIDIQDVAQALMYYSETRQREKAETVLTTVLHDLSDGRGTFYYKLHENGQINKTSFIRWGQAPMFLGLCKYLEMCGE